MKYRTRTYYTDAQKALMWDRWKQGWTLHQIAHLFNRSHTSVQGILSRTGGFRPPLRSRCARALTLAEREEISRAVVNGQSIRSIAALLGRAPSTICREINRNGGQSDYRATEAEGAAWDRALRPRNASLLRTALSRGSWPISCAFCGHRSRSPDGSNILTRATRVITCHTRPSIAVCSSKRVVP